MNPLHRRSDPSIPSRTISKASLCLCWITWNVTQSAVYLLWETIPFVQGASIALWSSSDVHVQWTGVRKGKP